jgi:hypothetical protein
MKQLENTLIDNSFEDRMINNFDFIKLIILFKNRYFKYYDRYSIDFEKCYTILKERLFKKRSFKEISKDLNLFESHIRYLYNRDLKRIQSLYIELNCNNDDNFLNSETYKQRVEKMKYWLNVEKSLTNKQKSK